jgi:hypothetical protein
LGVLAVAADDEDETEGLILGACADIVITNGER